MHRLGPRDAAALRLPLEAAASGAWSVPEAELLELVAASQALPAPWANPGLTTADGRSLTTPDVWFDDVAMAVMVHSRRYHSSPDDWDDTVDADGDLTTAGVVVAGVTPHRIRTSPNEVLRRLERTHAARDGTSAPGRRRHPTAPAAGCRGA